MELEHGTVIEIIRPEGILSAYVVEGWVRKILRQGDKFIVDKWSYDESDSPNEPRWTVSAQIFTIGREHVAIYISDVKPSTVIKVLDD